MPKAGFGKKIALVETAAMEPDAAVKQKVLELSEALKAEGLWKRQEPEWVNTFRGETEICDADFFEWLQFVYLPNRLLTRMRQPAGSGDAYITLQAKKFLGEQPVSREIVRLLVELDSLT